MVGVSGSPREMAFSSNFRNFLADSDSDVISSTSAFRVRGFSATCLDLSDVALLGAGALPLLRFLLGVCRSLDGADLGVVGARAVSFGCPRLVALRGLASSRRGECVLAKLARNSAVLFFLGRGARFGWLSPGAFCPGSLRGTFGGEFLPVTNRPLRSFATTGTVARVALVLAMASRRVRARGSSVVVGLVATVVIARRFERDLVGVLV